MSNDSPESVSAVPMVDYSKKKRRILIWMLVYAAILGVVTEHQQSNQEGALETVQQSRQDGVADAILGLPILVLAISWCLTDAKERNHRIGTVMKLLLVFIFACGFPLYLLQTRGSRGLKAIGLSILFSAAMAFCMTVTGAAASFVRTAIGH